MNLSRPLFLFQALILHAWRHYHLKTSWRLCPPSLGKGDANWDVVTKYLPREAVKVCEIAEWNEEENIQGVVDFRQGKAVL